MVEEAIVVTVVVKIVVSQPSTATNDAALNQGQGPVVNSRRDKPVSWLCAASCRAVQSQAAPRAHSSGVERLIANQEAGVQFPLGR